MTIQLDQKTKERVNKAIINIRLIASRVKRANVQDAMQRCEIVVISLNNFRQYVNFMYYNPNPSEYMGAFNVNVYTLERMVEALQQVDIIYAMLTRDKRTSYKEELKQVQILLMEVCEYLTLAMNEGDEHATREN